MLGLLEEASLRTDPAVHRRALTFVTAGGGFSGVETAGAINDLVREAVRYYPGMLLLGSGLDVVAFFIGFSLRTGLVIAVVPSFR